MKGKIRNLKKLARLNKYNGIEDLEKYTRKLFRYRQKDRRPKKKAKLNQMKGG